MNKVEDVFSSQEELTSDEKPHVLDTNYEFPKQFVPRRLDTPLADKVKMVRYKTWDLYL